MDHFDDPWILITYVWDHFERISAPGLTGPLGNRGGARTHGPFDSSFRVTKKQ